MKKFLVSAAMVAMLVAGTTANMFAQRGNAPVAQSVIAIRIGVIIICNVSVNAGFVRVTPIGQNNNLNAPNGNLPGDADDANNVSGNGTASFQVVGSQTSPVASSTYTPVSLNFSGSDPVYGTFNFSFDASRATTNSTVTAKQPGADFPASADIYANVTGTVSGLPGTYTNNSECHMTATINSWNPQRNETYTFVNDVTFSNANDPTAPTFTITAGTPVSMN